MRARRYNTRGGTRPRDLADSRRYAVRYALSDAQITLSDARINVHYAVRYALGNDCIIERYAIRYALRDD